MAEVASGVVNYIARFETVGDLFYRATGRLRPGKAEPLATNRDANSEENRALFDEWMATKCFGAALDEIEWLRQRVADLEQRLSEADDELELYR